VSSTDGETFGIREHENPVDQKQEVNVERRQENAEPERKGTSATPESESRLVHQLAMIGRFNDGFLGEIENIFMEPSP
jgi:hypothetical protein